jgi:hypothetical protein
MVFGPISYDLEWRPSKDYSCHAWFKLKEYFPSLMISCLNKPYLRNRKNCQKYNFDKKKPRIYRVPHYSPTDNIWDDSGFK